MIADNQLRRKRLSTSGEILIRRFKPKTNDVKDVGGELDVMMYLANTI
jgi:hypothetical protein